MKYSPKYRYCDSLNECALCGNQPKPIGTIGFHVVGIQSRYQRFIPVPQWTSVHACPPIGGLRHLIFYSKTKGFHKVIQRVGRRVLIDEAAFFNWVDQQGVSK